MTLRRRMLLVPAAFAALALTLGACGGDDEDATNAADNGGNGGAASQSNGAGGSGGSQPVAEVKQPSSLDACSLLTEEEVAAVLQQADESWAALQFTLTPAAATSASRDGTACEFTWQGAEEGAEASATGSFVLDLISDVTYEIKVANAEEAGGVGDELRLVEGIPYMRVGSLGVVLSGTETPDLAVQLLAVVEPKLRS